MLYPTPQPLISIARAEIDKKTTLCFACSSSVVPPSKDSSSTSGTPTPTADMPIDIFATPCCQRLICPTCAMRNPRLLRYNPCLACLGGVDIVCSSSGSVLRPETRLNIDGSMRDEDAFVLAGDDEKEEDPSVELDRPSQGPGTTMQGVLQGDTSVVTDDFPTDAIDELATSAAETEFMSLKYHITESDTLQGIILRFGLDGHELCRLNNLPSSTLRTTPHLLRTRRYLILPLTVRNNGILLRKDTTEQTSEREATRRKERAEKRLQVLTKEVDWRVAKAYVALADDPQEEEREEWERKGKESFEERCMGAGPSNLEERAIGKYLDDDEWEDKQLREGPKVGNGSMGVGYQNEKHDRGDGRWCWWK